MAAGLAPEGLDSTFRRALFIIMSIKFVTPGCVFITFQSAAKACWERLVVNHCLYSDPRRRRLEFGSVVKPDIWIQGVANAVENRNGHGRESDDDFESVQG